MVLNRLKKVWVLKHSSFERSLQLHEDQLFVEDMSTPEMNLLLMIVTHLTKMDLPTLEK